MSTTGTKIRDLTEEVNFVSSAAKESVINLIKRFDFESTNDKDKAKHYPLTYVCNGGPEEVATALEQISSTCWRTLLKELQGVVIESHAHLPLKPYAHDETSNQKLNVKLGKVYMCPPNRFSHVNTDVDEVKLFAFGYEFEGGYEVSGEINFGIEIY